MCCSFKALLRFSFACRFLHAHILYSICTDQKQSSLEQDQVRLIHLEEAEAVQMRIVPSYLQSRHCKKWNIRLEARNWKIGHRLWYSASSIDLLQWTVTHRVKDVMWWKRDCFLIKRLSMLASDDALIVFFLFINKGDFRNAKSSISYNTCSREATFATFIIPQHPFLCSLTQFASVSIRSVSHLQNHLRGTIPLVRNPLSTQGANNSSWSLYLFYSLCWSLIFNKEVYFPPSEKKVLNLQAMFIHLLFPVLPMRLLSVPVRWHWKWYRCCVSPSSHCTLCGCLSKV